MNEEFLLPDLGEGLTEAEIVAWHVAPGDPVALNQTLAEVETAKAVVELPSPYEGTVSQLHAAAGDTVPVGAPLIAFTLAEDDSGPVPVAEEPAEPNLVGYGAAPASGRPARRARRATEGTRVAVLPDRDAPPGDLPDAERPRSTPPVRMYAKERGVDIALVAHEVGDRVITRADVAAFAERSDAHQPPHPRQTRIPIRGVRKATAQAMVASAFAAPHVTTFHSVDVTRTMELIAALREDASLGGVRIGPLAVAAKAVCLALGRNPTLNSHWDEDAGEIVQYGYVDLGIAAATERGLIVPHIRDAQEMTLPELAEALRTLTETARSGKTSPSDLSGGTFSITNIGVFGVEAGTPILPPGQSGILALGAVRRQPWEHRGEIALREVMTLSLSFDHRLVDGAEGTRFLRDVADILAEPGRAMLLR